jgi:hypothetical protein
VFCCCRNNGKSFRIVSNFSGTHRISFYSYTPATHLTAGSRTTVSNLISRSNL